MVPFEPKIAGIIGVKVKDWNDVKRWRSKLLNDVCWWTWKAHANLSVFYWASQQANSVVIKPSTKRSATHAKIFKPTLHSLGWFLGKSLNVKEFKTCKIGGNHSHSPPFFPFLRWSVDCFIGALAWSLGQKVVLSFNGYWGKRSEYSLAKPEDAT